MVKYCIKNNIKIGKAILISGFNHMLGLDEDYDYVNCTMYTNRYKEFIELCPKRICIHSDNDPYVPQDKLHEFIDMIDGEEVFIKNGGHFNTDSGYETFPLLLDLIRR